MVARTLADENHAVVSVISDKRRYCKVPCPECPWRKANAGSFPAEAFRISADTAKDMSTHTFACHMAGKETPAVCAGFLLSESANDNMAVRIMRIRGESLDVAGEPQELFSTYRKMAQANGVKRTDPALYGCMPEHRHRRTR